MRIVTAGNVVVPAILLLEERGFSVSRSVLESVESWSARKGATEVTADDPVQLLGLSLLAEVRGEAWQASDEQIDDAVSRFHLDAPPKDAG